MTGNIVREEANYLHVLLAEVDALNRKVTIIMLKRLGYEVDAVSNGIEVLQALADQTYDLVLLNICMPEMGGIEAAREIRKRWHNSPKIVALTAYVLPDIREKCLDAGMDDCIIKPVRLADLAEVLRKYHPSYFAS